MPQMPTVAATAIGAMLQLVATIHPEVPEVCAATISL